MKQLFVLVCCCSLLSCNFFKPKEDHLSPDKMAKVLTDLQVAEMYSTMVGRDTAAHKGQEKNLDSLAHYYKEILAHHQVSLDELNKSLEWYRQNPDQLDSVYTAMIPQLTALQGLKTN